MAILSTSEFDALTVNHETVLFEGASRVHVNKKGGFHHHRRDVDDDGDVDLVFHFRLGDTNLTSESTEGSLSGETLDGVAITGCDDVQMIDRRHKSHGWRRKRNH